MRKRGRRRGSFDKSRDYAPAVAKMRALIAKGVSEREAARVVGAELGIPHSTLRNHLGYTKQIGPRLGVEIDISGMLQAMTREEMEAFAQGSPGLVLGDAGDLHGDRIALGSVTPRMERYCR